MSIVIAETDQFIHHFSLVGSSAVRASGLALVILTNMGAAFTGVVIGAVGAGLLHSLALAGAMTVPTTLGAAYLAGGWATRRQDPPTEREVTIGCWAFFLLCVLVAWGSRHHAAVLFATIGGFGVSFCFFRGAQRAWTRAPRVQPLPADVEAASAPKALPSHPDRASGMQTRALEVALGRALVLSSGLMLSSSISSLQTEPRATTQSVVAHDSVSPDESVSEYADTSDRVDPRPATARPNINPEQHLVSGYTRSNGTYVAPHVATNPDHDTKNNLSSPGNHIPSMPSRGHR